MLIFILIIVLLIVAIITGCLTRDLHIKKKYDGNAGFLLGFFCGFIGLLYAVGLPDKTDKLIIKEDDKTIITTEDENDENTELCPFCNYPILENETICRNCGEKIKR